jgi:hypothetical protein
MKQKKGLSEKKQWILYVIIIRFLKHLKSKYTMTYNRQLFLDIVNDKMVNEYKDCYGNLYMAQSKLGWRVLKT